MIGGRGRSRTAEIAVMTENPLTHDRRTRPTSVLGGQVGLVAIGSSTLVTFIVLGFALQVGVQQCAVCAGNSCGPAVEVCPGSLFELEFFTTVLFAAALLIGIGLSRSAIKWLETLGEGPADEPLSSPSHPAIDVMAPTLTFFGWALLTLGLLLPWDVFGDCIDGPCDFPYVLSEYPLLLAIVGGITFVVGFTLIRLPSLQRGRSN
jgi:hypothetical protein